MESKRKMDEKDLKEQLLDGVGAHNKKTPNESFHSDDDSS